ncbi:hypothetical protein R5R35_004910 [Gryllus longicercus]|uniref:Uncharacterized protein n=1 Tax=Gryllus longicercus TaxID=2509291 RepID=A0AAN9VH54_9ORTH
MLPGIDSQFPQLPFDFYQAALTQTSIQTELLCQLAHNLSLPQVPPNLFGSLSGVPFSTNQLNPSNFKLDCELPSSQASNVVSDYVKDRPNISITPISHSNTVKLKNSAPVSASSASANNSSGNFGSSLLEKSSRSSSTYATPTGSGPSPSLKDTKYSSHDNFSTAFKNKELLLSSTGIKNQGLTISPSTSVINISPSKSSGYKNSYPSQGNGSKSGFTHDTYGNVSNISAESKSSHIPVSKVEHKSLINSGPGSRSLTNNLHANPEITVSSPSGGLSLFPQRSKDLQIIPMTSADNPITIHPVSSNYKQTASFNTDISASQEEELDLSVNYSPPIKKVKDSVSIMEVQRVTSTKMPTKRVSPPAPAKKEEPKTVVGSDVEVITLE